MSQPKKEAMPTPLKFLSMVLDLGLSKEAYECLMRIMQIAPRPQPFPTYDKLQELKKKCVPNLDYDHDFCDWWGEVKLQPLMDHTARRLLVHLDKTSKALSGRERLALQIKYKWGYDSTKQSLYEEEEEKIIQTSLVPLQLVCKLNKKIIWENPIPWSSHYCRPIRIRFMEAAPDVVLEEIDNVKDGISTLKASKIFLYNKTFTVQHIMTYTKIDDEVCNADAHSSGTLKCYICDLTTQDFNNLDMVTQQNVKPPGEQQEFGLSISHIRVRLFESLLYLSYKLPLKKWQTNDAADEAIIKKTKKEIRKKFAKEMNSRIDSPKPGGGTYNDGWLSRKFFHKPEKTAEITGINVGLIKRFKVIMETVSCRYKIDMDKFRAYALKTAELYVELYSWYPMTATMHKLLMHGPTIIEHCILAIGQISRAAEKIQSKHVPMFRSYFFSEFSQENCNKEILNNLLARSDPVLTGLSSCMESKKKWRSLLDETKQLLLPAPTDIPQEDDTIDDSDEEVDDDDDDEYSSDEN